MSDVHEAIRALVTSEPVVLFMKGNRQQPQCGFSAKVVDILDELLDAYTTRDVLADPALREAIKLYSDWPTLPQLYIQGKFVGGADLVTELHRSGELVALIQAAVPGAAPAKEVRPEVVVTEQAAEAFRRFSSLPHPSVRLTIDADYDIELELELPRRRDVVLELAGIRLAMDRRSAERANGATIDFDAEANGFRVENPNKPAAVRSLSVAAYAEMRERGKPHLLLDVRPPVERELASIDGSELLDGEMMERLMELDRATPIVCLCHHGIRSLDAAKQLTAIGYGEVYNLVGGIAAWSAEIDPSVPTY